MNVRRSNIETAVREYYGEDALEYFRQHPSDDVSAVIKTLERAGFARKPEPAPEDRNA